MNLGLENAKSPQVLERNYDMTMAESNGKVSSPKGQQSIVAEYCERRLVELGYEQCIILVLRRGGKYQAMDIPVNRADPKLGLDRLRRESGPWWKRWSLYSAVGVQEVDVLVLEGH